MSFLNLRNMLFRRFRLPKSSHRPYSGPPPTYPTYDPVHVSPEILGRRSTVSTFFRWFVAGIFVGLPSYWILWLGQKVSVPYCIPLLEGKWLMVDIERVDVVRSRMTEQHRRILICILPRVWQVLIL